MNDFIENTVEKQPPTTIQPLPAIKNGFFRIFIYLIAIMFTQIIAGIVIIIIAYPFLPKPISMTGMPSKSVYFLLLFSIVSFLFSLLVTWLFRKFIDKKTVISLGFEFKNRFKEMFLGFFFGTILIVFGFLILYLTKNITISDINFYFYNLLLFIIAFLFVALNEELIFRGYILNNLMSSLNKYFALAISAVIFAIFHGFNPNLTLIGLINIALAGVLLGIFYIHKKNLWFPIMLHLAWNYFQGPILGFEVSGIQIDKTLITQQISGKQLITGGSFGFEGSILVTILMIISITIIHLIYKKDDKKCD